MQKDIKFVHTNIIAKDWKSLCRFYCDVFGCKPTYPERDLSGDWLDKITEIPNARIRGMHLTLPGYENGPTLEIFQYDQENLKSTEAQINKQGFGHIAFHVDNVAAVLKDVVDHGGKVFGEIVQKQYPEPGLLTVVYVKDPEGNYIELQNWKR